MFFVLRELNYKWITNDHYKSLVSGAIVGLRAGRLRHLVAGGGGAGCGGAGDYWNGPESRELEPEELLLELKPEPEPEEAPPRPCAPVGAWGPGPGTGVPGSQEVEAE